MKAIATVALLAKMITAAGAVEYYNSAINLLSGCKAVIEERKPYPNGSIVLL